MLLKVGVVMVVVVLALAAGVSLAVFQRAGDDVGRSAKPDETRTSGTAAKGSSGRREAETLPVVSRQGWTRPSEQEVAAA